MRTADASTELLPDSHGPTPVHVRSPPSRARPLSNRGLGGVSTSQVILRMLESSPAEERDNLEDLRRSACQPFTDP